jgi:glycosyltransferase A (GT-A) superfamily protein (DUF2064 family)
VLVVDGPLTADGFDRQPQRGGPLDERLAAAYDDAAATSDLPALLIGMDTPQVTPALLAQAARDLLAHDAVLGLAPDGGWWALGLRHPAGHLLAGVPTSRNDTGRLQLERLRAAGARRGRAPRAARRRHRRGRPAVAALAPGSRFAAALAARGAGAA